MRRINVIKQIKQTHQEKFPDVELILFGSEARGDAQTDSDIDLLALIDTPTIKQQDRERISHPLYEIELQTNTIITPIIRSRQQWLNQPMTFFKRNIINEGIRL